MRSKGHALVEVDHASISGEIGARIRAQREGKGVSQDELGKMLGISFQQVQKYERGTNSISISRLLQISIALQVTAEDLISGIMPSNENLCRISNTNIEAKIDHIDPKPDPQNVSTVKGIPNWPRGMNDRMAAAYIGIKVGKFRTQVARGIAPAAIDLGCDSEVWFREHLDAWLDKMLTQVEFS